MTLGRSGGASGSVTVGYGKFREQRGGTRSTGGNRLPLGDQESVGRNAQRGVVMEAAPPTPFKMAESKLLLKLLIVALDAPAQFGDVDQPAERDVFRKGREPVFGRLVLALGPLDQQPLFRSALGELVITAASALPTTADGLPSGTSSCRSRSLRGSPALQHR